MLISRLITSWGSGSNESTIRTTLGAGQRTLVVKNLAAFQERYGVGHNIAGVFTGTLDNAGEPISILGPLGEPILSFDYKPDWYPITNTGGYTLVVRDPATATGAILSSSSGWRAGSVT